MSGPYNSMMHAGVLRNLNPWRRAWVRSLSSSTAEERPSKPKHTRVTPDAKTAQADDAFSAWCSKRGILRRGVELGHVILGGRKQRGLFATETFKAGDPIVAVPHDACLGRAHHPNSKLVALTDQLWPRGSPPLRPLTPDELVSYMHLRFVVVSRFDWLHFGMQSVSFHTRRSRKRKRPKPILPRTSNSPCCSCWSTLTQILRGVPGWTYCPAPRALLYLTLPL